MSEPVQTDRHRPATSPLPQSAEGKDTGQPPFRHGFTAVVLVPTALLCFQAVLLFASADEPSLVGPILALAGCVGLFFQLRPLVDARVFRIAVIALVLLMLVRLFGFTPPTTERGFVVLPRPLTISLAEFLLACQVLIIWRSKKAEPLPPSLPGLALITLVLSLNKNLDQDSTSAYVFLVTVAMLVPTFMSHTQGREKKLTRGAQIVVGLVCVCVLLGTMLFTEAWSRWLPNAQRWFATTVGRTINVEQRAYRYATSGSLSVIHHENTNDPNIVALRVYADRTPGYLAGRTFDYYAQGEWFNAWEARERSNRPWLGLRRLTPVPRPDNVNISVEDVSVFALDERPTTDNLRDMRIENDPRRGRVYFTPRGCRFFAGYGADLDVDQHDIVRAGVSVRSPYYAFSDAATTSPPLSSALRQQLLIPAVGLDGSLKELAARICRDCRTTREKVVAVRGFFQENFEYSLERVGVRRDVDPLNQFLLTRHPAHCEFFASGAVALLRYQGVPTRYVTGYRVTAKEDGEEYWVGRNRDAHAWAEAYDDEQQQWILVEATPGFDDTLDDGALTDASAAATAAAGGLAFTRETASQLAQWWNGLSLWIRVPLCLVLLGVLSSVLYFSIQRANLRALGQTSNDPRIRSWRRLLVVMDRRLKKRGWVREPYETLHQFACRLEHDAQAAHQNEQESGDSWLTTSARWYVEYANTRFRPSCTQPPPLPALRGR